MSLLLTWNTFNSLEGHPVPHFNALSYYIVLAKYINLVLLP